MDTSKVKSLSQGMSRATSPYLDYIQKLRERYNQEFDARYNREVIQDERQKKTSAVLGIGSAVLLAGTAPVLSPAALGIASGLTLVAVGKAIYRQVAEPKVLQELSKVSHPSWKELEAADVSQRRGIHIEAKPSSSLARLWDRAMSSIGLREEQSEKASLVDHVMHRQRMAEHP